MHLVGGTMDAMRFAQRTFTGTAFLLGVPSPFAGICCIHWGWHGCHTVPVTVVGAFCTTCHDMDLNVGNY